jgi:sugar O-acyltransferase (sialic acid O-acetyltransferase NeuD family)
MKLALYGYGGHAREVAAQIDQEVTFFVDDEYINNNIVKPISQFDPEEYLIMVAIADPKSRFNAVNKLPKQTKYFTFIHPTALIMDDNIQIGEGSFIGAYSILTTNINIGKHAILNRANHIGHDSIIGNYFSAMPGAIVSGNVHIGNYVYLGTNSSIIEKKYLLHNIIIGANAVVVKDVTESGTYVGVPLKKLNNENSHIL